MERTCATCQRIENPLGRLRFKKSRLDGKIYCEAHWPLVESLDDPREPEPTPVPSFSLPKKTSAGSGHVVIPCPSCKRNERSELLPSYNCDTCGNYGSVRIDPSYLNVYRPARVKPPELLTED